MTTTELVATLWEMARRYERDYQLLAAAEVLDLHDRVKAEGVEPG